MPPAESELRPNDAVTTTDAASRDAGPGADQGLGSDVALRLPDANLDVGAPVDATSLHLDASVEVGPPPDGAPPPPDARPEVRPPPDATSLAPDLSVAADALIPGPEPDSSPAVDAFVMPPLTCSTCHGDADSAAPPRALDGRLETSAPGVGAHRAHLAPASESRQVVCEDCHRVPDTPDAPGHIDRRPADLEFGPVASADGVQPAYVVGTCTVYCHGASLGGGSIAAPLWTRVDGTQASCGSCHGLPPPAPHPADADCASCHGEVMSPDGGFRVPELHIDGRVQVEVIGCVGCHGLPPETGSHRIHAALAPAEYGSLTTAADQPGGDGYAFGCGHCHPRDPARHRDGRVDVDLFDPEAPPGTLKSKNPASAAYDPASRTCADTSCHAGISTTSGAVPEPLVDFPFVGFPIAYPAYEVTRATNYAQPVWGAPGSGCGGCHGYPPRAAWPDTDAAAGESHAYVNHEGTEDLHFFNHGFAPLSCATCHIHTVTAAALWSRDGFDVITLQDIPIADFGRHVNGTVDVAFDPITPLPYRRVRDLAAARWDAERRTCNDVACHLQQSEVSFGAPYRYANWVECDSCHRYGGVP